jgi:hypothetical protein
VAKRHAHSILAVAGLVALLFLSCCKQPMQPVEEPKLNFNEPDTIKSSVSFILNSPLRYSYRWELRTPADTISRGAVTSTGVVTRRNVWLEGGIAFGHNLKSNSYSLRCLQSSELFTEDIIRPDSLILDALRSSRIAELYISFYDIPRSFTVPLKNNYIISDTTLSISFTDKRLQEQFVYSGMPVRLNIVNVVTDVFGDIQYSPRYWKSIDTSLYNPTSLNRYRTRLERAEIILDRYDTVRQRVDGQFSFRMIGYENTVIEVKDGRFTNVKLYRYNE